MGPKPRAKAPGTSEAQSLLGGDTSMLLPIKGTTSNNNHLNISGSYIRNAIPPGDRDSQGLFSCTMFNALKAITKVHRPSQNLYHTVHAAPHTGTCLHALLLALCLPHSKVQEITAGPNNF